MKCCMRVPHANFRECMRQLFKMSTYADKDKQRFDSCELFSVPTSANKSIFFPGFSWQQRDREGGGQLQKDEETNNIRFVSANNSSCITLSPSNSYSFKLVIVSKPYAFLNRKQVPNSGQLGYVFHMYSTPLIFTNSFDYSGFELAKD